jgi:hypothetical protein
VLARLVRFANQPAGPERSHASSRFGFVPQNTEASGFIPLHPVQEAAWTPKQFVSQIPFRKQMTLPSGYWMAPVSMGFVSQIHASLRETTKP